MADYDKPKEELLDELIAARRRIDELESLRRKGERAAEAVREREAQMATIFRAAPSAIGLLYNRIFQRVNSRMLEMTGYTEGELLGQSSRMLYETEDEFRRVAEVKYATIRRTGLGEVDTCWRRKDGAVREVHLRSAAVDREDLSTGVIFTAIDITDRKQASEEKLRAISDGALDAVVMIDEGGRVMHWNPAAERMFGYRQHEILGRNAHDVLVPPRFREMAARGFREFAVAGTGRAVGQVLELTALRKDGSEFAIEIAVSPIRVDGRWAAAAIIRDITERKQAEQIVEQERQHLERLLEMYERDRKLTAFEIHDGLTQTLTAALMQLEGGLAAARHGRLDELPRNLAASVQLLRDSLKEARRLIGGLRPAGLDAQGLPSALDHLIEEKRAGGGATIEYVKDVQFGRLTPPLETAIFRVIQEALNNALRCSKSARVRLSLTQQDDHILVAVQDWGVGFDPGKVAGNHFGLEGIRLRAQLFGGKVTVESNPGEGTRVAVDFPNVARAKGQESEETRSPPGPFTQAADEGNNLGTAGPRMGAQGEA
jgi:hypothetical protein